MSQMAALLVVFQCVLCLLMFRSQLNALGRKTMWEMSPVRRTVMAIHPE